MYWAHSVPRLTPPIAPLSKRSNVTVKLRSCIHCDVVNGLNCMMRCNNTFTYFLGIGERDGCNRLRFSLQHFYDLTNTSAIYVPQMVFFNWLFRSTFCFNIKTACVMHGDAALSHAQKLLTGHKNKNIWCSDSICSLLNGLAYLYMYVDRFCIACTKVGY